MGPGKGAFHVEQVLYWSAVTALLVVCVCHQWYGFDIWYHLALGREVVQHGSPAASGTVLLQQPAYRNIYWVFQVLTWFVYSHGGMFAVTAVLAGIWFATFALWANTATAIRLPIAGVPLTAAAIVACQLRFEERPEVLSYFFLALHLWLIAQLAAGAMNKTRVAVWLVSQAIWTNVHGYFVFGPAVLAFWLVSNSFRGLPSDRLVRGWQILAGVSAATLVSPFGLGAWGTVFEYARYLAAMKGAVIEFRPYPLSGYGWTVGFFWCWSTLIAVVAVRDLVAARRLYEPTLGITGVALGVLSARNAPLAVFMSAPLLAHYLQPMSEFLDRRRLRRALPVLASVLALAYTARVLATGSYAPLVSYEYSPGAALSTDDYPVSAAEYLRQSGFAGSLFALPSDGSYLEYVLPSVHPYADSRFIDAALTSQYFRALRQPSDFQTLHARWHFDSVLINVREDETHLVSLLADRRTWTLVYADPYRCVLANRRTRTGAALVEGPIRFYAGQRFERPVDYNAAGSWLEGFAEAGRPDLFALALRQLGAAPDFPPEFRSSARAYAAKVGSVEIAEAAMARPATPK